MTEVRLPLLRRHLYPAALVTGLALLFALFATDLGHHLAGAETWPVHADTGQQMVPLTSTGTSMDGFAVWSADGRQVLFMRDGQIWTIMPEPRKVTGRAGVWDAAPRWLPGGDQFVFVRLQIEDGTTRVMLRSLRTGRETELAREGEQIGYVAVSPDGRDIVYTTKKRVVKLEQMQRMRTILAVGGAIDMLPGGIVYSPDGKTVVFGLGEPGKLNLFRMPAAGGKMERLTHEGGIMPAFAPGGSRIAYRRPTGQSGIWVLDLPTGKGERVVADGRGALFFHPNFAPTGTGLLLSRLNIRSQGRPNSDIVSLNLPEGRDR